VAGGGREPSKVVVGDALESLISEAPQHMGLLKLAAILLTILSTPMFIVGLLSGSAVLWAGSFVVWGVGLLGYAVCRVADKARKTDKVKR
jgi:hypothetical protein